MSRFVLDEETSRFGRMLHYIGLLLAVVCGTVTYSFTHAPLVRQIVSTTSHIDELRQSLQNTSGAFDERVKLAKQVEESRNRINALYQRVPNSQETGPFLREVGRIAKEEGVRLSDFRPGTVSARQGYSQLDIALTGSGSYTGICTFFDRVSHLPRLSKVIALTIHASNGQGDYPLTATIVVYFDLNGAPLAAEMGA